MTCPKCNQHKEIEEFPYKNKSKNKRSTICKVCQREYKNKHYRENKKAHYERNQKTKVKLIEYYKQIKLESECLLCGECEYACLDFHHLDPTSKVKNVGVLTAYGSIKNLQLEIEKCVVLCSNCHRKLHAGVVTL
jgi:hypothetical protein